MDNLHLPWDDTQLQELLQRIIPLGEAAKVDFKKQLELTPAAHSELLKDIQAFANTFDYNYDNYGFIIFGVDDSKLCFTTFEQNVDKLQATIDEVVKIHIEPFVPTYLKIFGSGESAWGAVVIPPTRNAPHVIVKDTHKRNRGEINVRRGTTTDKALPSDFARFFRQHLEEEMYGVQQQIRELRKSIAQVNTTKVVHVFEDKVALMPESPKEIDSQPGLVLASDVEPLKSSKSLLNIIEQALNKDNDPIEVNLLSEVKKLNTFLRSGELTWAIWSEPRQSNVDMLVAIEDRCLPFWQALNYLVKNDQKQKYNEAIYKAIKTLSKQYEPPLGERYTDVGKNLRYYPLVMSLYITFIQATANKNSSLLTKIQGLELIRPSNYNSNDSILNSLFYIRRSEDAFQTRHSSYPSSGWCDAVGSTIKDFFENKIDLDEDISDVTAKFFIGEFLLCIAPPISNGVFNSSSCGAFLFHSDSDIIIRRFISKKKEWLQTLFGDRLRTLLERFDKSAPNLANRERCWGSGFQSGAVQAVFPDSEPK